MKEEIVEAFNKVFDNYNLTEEQEESIISSYLVFSEQLKKPIEEFPLYFLTKKEDE